jgi:MATE family multidrug resistance protein
MPQPLSPAAHARALLAIALPLVGGLVAQMGLQVTDTIMLGWYGVRELAAGVLGSAVFYAVFILGAGFAHAVMPLVAASLGQGNATEARRVTRMGLWLSAGFGLIVYPLFWFAAPILRALGQEPEVAQLTQDYVRIAGLGMVPALMVMVLRSFLAALTLTQVVLWATVAALFLNAGLNWALIFGNWGAPELGIRGAAIATFGTQVLTLLIMGVYAARQPRAAAFAIWARFHRADPAAALRVWRLGWPIGVQGLTESSLFYASALMVGTFGAVPLAAHGIAMQIVSVLFMVHLGLANAATIRTGHFLGAGDRPALRSGAVVALALSAGAAALFAVLFLAVPRWLMGLYLDASDAETPAIVAAGVTMLAVAALFQFVDAGQVMAMGLLRGVQDTRVPMLIAAVSYWGVGIPASWWIGLHLGHGAPGVWAGLVLGLLVAAVLLLWRFRRLVQGRPSGAVSH